MAETPLKPVPPILNGMGVVTLGNLELDRDRFVARIDAGLVDLTYT